MVELTVGTYGLLCWLVFKKFKLVPVTTYTVCTAILGGGVILLALYISLSIFHPSSNDGRLYAPVVQIVPSVRGLVIEVPVEGNKPLKKGDILFRIDPVPFQIEVDRLRAVLAGKNRDFADAVDKLAAAEAATKEARANLLVSESLNDRQLRETYERAKSQVEQTGARLTLAKQQYDRMEKLLKTGSGSQAEFDLATSRKLSLEQEYSQVKTDEKIAAEKLKSGGSSLEADVQNLARLEAEERRARTVVNTRIDGKETGQKVTPEEREVMAQLDKARWDLDQTIVRAPTDGYVPQLVLRPGTMATATRLVPLMMFVVDENPTLVATYPQRVVSDIKPGMAGEATFKQYPGRTFKVKVRRVLTAVREGELDASGQILTATPEQEHGYIPVVFDYDEDVSGLNLPVGAQATIAVYTDRLHALSILRKIIIRIHSWENYII
ncbi:MAG TPA: biotin/lipoyl-binding protein [Fimbriiglobus sp.]|jgi:multidrug resistance efflux pump